MKNLTQEAVESLDALSVAGEFLMCAVRAIAHGADINSPDVLTPVAWAKSKIEEAFAKEKLEGGG